MLRRLLANALIASGGRAERGGHLELACRRYRAAAAVAPRHAPALLNLGAALEAAGDVQGAERAYERLLEADPADPFGNYNLGRLRYARGDLAEATRLLGRALQARPAFADALIALANVQDALGEPRAAAASLEAALRLQPEVAGAWHNYGDALFKLARHDEAEDALRRCLSLAPGFVPAWQLLCNLLRATGRTEESRAAIAQARRLDPERYDLESQELLTLSLSDRIAAQDLFERHRAFGRRLEEAIAPRAAPYPNPRDPERLLRVGYLSCDFRRHPVSWFLLPLLEREDRARIESICYDTGAQPDEVTAQVRAAAAQWREVAMLSDEALAHRVEQDRIDVLVDLTGHTGALRLGVFARQPAPVQVSWLGYLHSTGLTRIDARLSDARADPPGGSEALHTESLVRLPHSQWCFRPAYDVPVPETLPGQPTGKVTFGSFHHASKLSATARRHWIDVLRAIPNARLRLVGVPASRGRDLLLRDFAEAGIDAARISVAPRVSMGEYLREFEAVDIALDSTPYGGGTTTFDALWMGVPVLALAGAGERPAARSAASILGALGLDDWIARTHEEFVDRATAHAADPSALSELRRSLRGRLRTSPLMDEARFARDMEAALRGLWRAWCLRGIH